MPQILNWVDIRAICRPIINTLNNTITNPLLQNFCCLVETLVLVLSDESHKWSLSSSKYTFWCMFSFAGNITNFLWFEDKFLTLFTIVFQWPENFFGFPEQNLWLAVSAHPPSRYQAIQRCSEWWLTRVISAVTLVWCSASFSSTIWQIISLINSLPGILWNGITKNYWGVTQSSHKTVWLWADCLTGNNAPTHSPTDC